MNAHISPPADPRVPHSVDAFVGSRIRGRRRVIGMSQTKLGEIAGITFQQVQKYEKGANRVSGSRLYAVARALKVPVGYFFEGLPDPTADVAAAAAEGEPWAVEISALDRFLDQPEAMDLVEAFAAIENGQARRAIVQTARACAGAATS